MEFNRKDPYETIRQWEAKRSRRFLYSVTRSRKYSEELGWFITFGLEITNRSTGEQSFLDDISPNLDGVLRFAELCAEMEVEPAHLLDAAENFLAGLYGMTETVGCR